MKKILFYLCSFGLIGTITSIIGFTMLVDNLTFNSKAATTTGTLLDITRTSASTGRCYVIGFRSQRGIEIKFSPSICDGSRENKNSLQVGQAVKVYYDPANPQNARIDDFTLMWLPTLILLSVGVSFLITSVVMLRLLLKRRKPPSSDFTVSLDTFRHKNEEG